MSGKKPQPTEWHSDCVYRPVRRSTDRTNRDIDYNLRTEITFRRSVLQVISDRERHPFRCGPHSAMGNRFFTLQLSRKIELGRCNIIHECKLY